MTKEDIQRMLVEGTLTWEQLVEFVAAWMKEDMDKSFTFGKDLSALWREDMA